MQELGSFIINTNWKNIEDLVTISDNKTYYIQNQGPSKFIYKETTQIPENNDTVGNRVAVDDKLIHIKATNNLYIRALNQSTKINIMEGE